MHTVFHRCLSYLVLYNKVYIDKNSLIFIYQPHPMKEIYILCGKHTKEPNDI